MDEMAHKASEKSIAVSSQQYALHYLCTWIVEKRYNGLYLQSLYYKGWWSKWYMKEADIF